MYQVNQHHIGMQGIAAAAQHAHITRADTQRGHIDGYIGARFVYHTYYTQRHRLFLDMQSVCGSGFEQQFTCGIRQCSNFVQARCQVLYPILVQ